MSLRSFLSPALDGAAVQVGDGTVRRRSIVIPSGEYATPFWLRSDASVLPVRVDSLPWRGVVRAGQLEVLSSEPSLLGTPVLNTPNAGDGQVALSWSDVASETGYDIHRSTTSPVAEDGSDLLTAGSGALAAGTESYTDSTAVNGTTYYYRVSATDGSTTTYSNEVSGTPSVSTALFSDGFEDEAPEANPAASSADWSWSDSSSPTTGDVNIADELAHTGSQSCRFEYWGENTTGNPDSRPELRYNHDQVSEFWMEFYLYYPDGTEDDGEGGTLNAYTHRESDGTTNNKFWVAWPEDYDQFQPGGTPYLLFETRKTFIGNNSQLEVKRSWGESGNQDYQTTGAGDAPGDVLKMSPFIDTATDLGQWHRIRIYIKLADMNTGNGIIKMWKNDTVGFESTNEHLYPLDDAQWNYLKYGYIMGAANSGFLNDTNVYMDDFAFYTSDPGWS